MVERNGYSRIALILKISPPSLPLIIAWLSCLTVYMTGLIHRTGVVTEMRSNLRPLRESSVHLQEKHIKCNCALTSKAAIDAIHCFV